MIFDFSVGEDTYRVKRSPDQERAAKRGGGVIKELGTAALWKRTGITAESDDGIHWHRDEDGRWLVRTLRLSN